MTSDELRQAAERIRQARKDSDNHGGGRLYAISDLSILAAAYLAEHPADDGDAVTEEWLESIGFEPAIAGWWLERFGYVNPDTGCICIEGNDDDGRAFRDGIHTRGDLRRLLAALKIETKEKQGE